MINDRLKVAVAAVGAGLLLAWVLLSIKTSLAFGILSGFPFIAIIILGLLLPRWQHIAVTAVVASLAALIVYSFVLKEEDPLRLHAAHLATHLKIWCAALLCILYRRTLDELTAKNRLLNLSRTIAAHANESGDVTAAFQACIDLVCKATGWPVGHIYLVDPRTQWLTPGVSWYFSEPERFAAFKKITEATSFVPGVGLPGRVLVSGKAEWIEDVDRDANFPRAKMGSELGIHGGFAFPVLVAKEVVGVMEFFSAKPEELDADILETMQHIGQQLGRVVERERHAQRGGEARAELERQVMARTAELQDNYEILEQEVVARRRAEAEIEFFDRQNKLILGSVAEGIFGLDLQGRFTFINPAGAALFEYGAGELLGQSVEKILAPPRQDWPEELRSDNPVYATLHDHTCYRVTDGLFWRKSGSCFPVEYTISSTVEADKVIGAVVVCRDITERKAAEEQKERLMQNLERANTELKDFAYSVSHDLKEPLRGVSSLAKWIAEDYGHAFDEDGRAQLKLLLDNTHRMHKLIEGILAYSRIGREKAVKSQIATGKLAQLIIDSLAIPPHIVVRTEGSFPTVRFYETHLEQMFQNLIGNAIKHLNKPEGEVVVSCRDAGEAWEFCVRDNGVGIEQRHFDRIFKLFQTLNKEANYAESTGIGLSLVKKIAEIHGEKVWVESSVGHGAAFFFTVTKSYS